MRASLGKISKKYASRAVTGLLSVGILAVTALTLTAPTATAAQRLTLPPGVHAVYHAPSLAKPDARLMVAATTVATYQVISGDTLSGIAATRLGHATEWQSLCTANAIADCNLIYVNQVLKLTTAVKTDAAVGSLATPAAPTPPHRITAPVHHTSAAPRPTAAPTTPAPTASYGSPQADAQAVFGAQAGCADNIIVRESGWNVHARNPYSGAYGLPQSLPAGKMASAGADWYSDPLTQLRWMKSYVDATYGGACRAWSFWQGHHSY